MAHPSATRDSASLADFLRVLRQRKLLILALTLVVMVVVAGVTAILPKQYLSVAEVRVQNPDGELKLFQTQTSTYYDPYFLQDQFRIMQSPKILYPVIGQLDLGRRLADVVGSPAALPNDLALAVLLNKKMVQLESPRNSSFIKINVYAHEPQLAADIANAIARVYSEDRVAFATAEQREGLAQLRRELEVQERNVTAQRDHLEKLRNDLNLAGVDLGARYSDMEIETLRQMQNSLISLRVDAIGRKTRWERFRGIPFEERINLVNSELITDANIQNLLQAYLVADQTMTRLQARLGPAHPDHVAAVDNRAKIREQLDGQLSGYEQALEMAYKEAEARVVELERQLGAAKVEQILSSRERLRPFEEAAQKLDDETKLLSTLKLTLRQREIDLQVPKRTIELLGEAQPARRPAKPNWPLNLLLATVCGLVLGVGTAVLIEYFDTSFRSVADVESKLGTPVVGVIPFRAKGAGFDPGDLAGAEPFRVLHTNVDLALPGRRLVALAIVSAGPGEGKSTVLHRLARVMATAGERVILVDGDLRRPMQHQLGGWARGPGLSEYLAGRANLNTIVQPQVAPGLDVISSGDTSGAAIGLLQAARLRDLMTALRERYDRILLDAPPIIGVSDASVLAGVADGILLVIQHRRNPQSMVLRAQQVVGTTKTPLIGAILNQVPTNSGEDYSYYTANYAYYGESSPKSVPQNKKQRRVAESGVPDPERLDLTEPDIRR
jgi:polysaccharide biosynthesis transport protein